MGSLGVRPRRGVLRLGSRHARAVAAACLAVGAFATTLTPSAAAYPCGDGGAPITNARQLMSASTDECRVPETLRHPKPAARENKKGSMSALTVFVLALAGALLIPIGRNGLPHGGDVFGHDPTPGRGPSR
jgi:hypothetical protein